MIRGHAQPDINLLWSAATELKLYDEAETYFKDLLNAIHSAQKEIIFQVYIFKEDEAGVPVAKALVAAAKKGVFVQLLVDAIGSNELSADFLSMMRESGCRVYLYQPLSFWKLKSKRFWSRNHRKLVLIDQEIAFLGGMNVEGRQLRKNLPEAYFDHAVQVKGPVVAKIESRTRAFVDRHLKVWRIFSGLKWPRRTSSRAAKQQDHIRRQRVAYVERDNFRYRTLMERTLVQALRDSRQSVIISAPYFFPGMNIYRHFRDACERGVTVDLILQGKTEFKLFQLASASLYPLLQRAGVRLHEYESGLLHSKAAVFDQNLSTVGSCNLDPLSFLVNLEANLWVDDQDFSQKLRKSLELAIEKDCCPIEVGFWERLSFAKRWLSLLGYYFLRLFVGFFYPRYSR
ncbi:MAG: cardiolipin synthase ClsB [Deltaproteobacteria bacterium CG11_big_fil_rev_8_21_14_0_20_45_16]|nr:MAG: cardiolipin synthase ClsB [Deltaproteobacteria bacterium CG11_big_fil_rev_8_21_14_0_20_45_16]